MIGTTVLAPRNPPKNNALLLRSCLKLRGKELKKIGDPDAAIGSAAKTVEADYETPFLAHMAMEPVNCTASVHDGKCEVWAPTQNPNGMATALASVLNLPQSALTIHITLIGGGFGRRLCIDYGVEAALVSRSAGAPVKVIWTRDDDIRHDYYRPISHHRLRAGLDAQGQVTSWLHHIAAPSTDSTFLGGELPDTGGTDIAGTGLPNGTVANYLLQQSFLHTAVPRGYWRAVDMNWNHFAVQCFMDEIAAATGKDPLALRRQLIATKQKPAGAADNEGDAPVNVGRLLGVLNLVAEKSGWGTPLPAGRGRGIAGLYGFGSYVAHVAEVTVAKDGTLRVDRVVVAVDCGQVINPDLVAAQIEGGVVFGLTSALYDEITIQNGQVQQTNFDGYPMLRIPDMPKWKSTSCRAMNHREELVSRGAVHRARGRQRDFCCNGEAPEATAVPNAGTGDIVAPLREWPVKNSSWCRIGPRLWPRGH